MRDLPRFAPPPALGLACTAPITRRRRRCCRSSPRWVCDECRGANPPMSFAAPLALVALAALPLLWWLLRVTPPSPRREIFPAIRLLLGLNPTEETPARTPWWLLLLRLIAAALVILALARPLLDSTGSMAGTGPVLLVIDNGWAAAADWPRRMLMANTVLDRAD